MEPNQSFTSLPPSLQPAASQSLEWAVCPGATEDAYISVLPHGTILTANSFTSLFLMRAELSSWERVQYEVHLLSGGLMQIGWCVTASGLPFTTKEGVGDFPLSVAADGCRGMLWNLTGDEVPALRWKPGDVLGCSADFATGTFDFSLNGAHCCTATLPTKGVLLQQGARWYTDRYSTDEMLTYSPALSLAGGEACLVNLGEAPFRYPRHGYVSLEMHHHFGSQAYPPTSLTITESDSSGIPPSTGSNAAALHSASMEGFGQPTSTPSLGGAGVGYSSQSRSSVPASSWSTSSAVRVGLGGCDLEDLFIALDIRVPACGNEEVGAMELLARCIVAPERRVSEAVLTLINWFEADTQVRWRAFCMVLYLWILRFYWYDESEESGDPSQRAPAVGAEPITRIAQSLSVTNRRRMADLLQCAKLFLPADHFLVVPGVLVAIVQHRLGNTPGAREKAASIVCDLLAIDAFRRGWVRETGTFCSTLLNLCAVHPPSAEELRILSELIMTHTLADAAAAAAPAAVGSPPESTASRRRSTTTAENNPSNRQAIGLLAAAKPLCVRQAKMWLMAEHCIELLVNDEECHGALVTALLRYVADTRLRSPVYFADPLRTPSYNDGLPYTFSLYMQPTITGLLVLFVASALGKALGPVDQSCPLTNADPLGGLRWRDMALNLLPVPDFYLHGLTGYGLMPTDWPDVRIGGSFHHVRRFIRDEEAALRQEQQERRRTAALASAKTSAPSSPLGKGQESAVTGEGAERDEGNFDDGDDGDASLPAAVTRRTRVAHTNVRSDASEAREQAKDEDEARMMRSQTRLRGESALDNSTNAKGEKEEGEVKATDPATTGQEEVEEKTEAHDDTTTTANFTATRSDKGGRGNDDDRRPGAVGGFGAPDSPVSLEANMSLWMNDTRFWESEATYAEHSRGHFTELNVADQPVDDTGRNTEVALAQRGKELLMVTAIASSIFVRPVLSSSLVFLETFNDAVDAYARERRHEQESDTAGTPGEGASGEGHSGSTSTFLGGSTTTATTATGTGGSGGTAAGAAPPGGRNDGDDGAYERLSAHDRLRGLAISVVPLAALTEQTTLQGLAPFAGAIGKVVSYYWSRMALFERLYAFPDNSTTNTRGGGAGGGGDTIGSPCDALGQLWQQEGEEAAVCPPRAFLMLPLAIVETPMDLWLFSSVAHRRGPAMTERYPGLLLASFDAARRRAVAPSQTRSYMYRAMASLLGFGAENRLQTSRLMLEQERHCVALNEADRSKGGGGHRPNIIPLVPVLQGSILDCLDVYMRDDNFNDAAALNFLFALAQEEHCLLPPPRMLDENFWWCLPPKMTSRAYGQDPGEEKPPAALPTADEAYFSIFCRATQNVDLLQYSTTVISKCNRLLTQFSQLRQVRSTTTMATMDIKAFHAKYMLLRKSLYVLDFILRAVDWHETQARHRETEREGEEHPLPADSTPTPPRHGEDGVPVQVFLQLSQREATISALMSLITQSLVRISFHGDPQSSRSTYDSVAGTNVAGNDDEASMQQQQQQSHQQPWVSTSQWPRQAATSSSARTGATTASPPSPGSELLSSSEARQRPSHATATATATASPPSSLSRRRVGSAAGAAASVETGAAESHWSENVLLPARSRSINGHYVCASSPCTVTGLLAPVFSMLHRIILADGGSVDPTRNPFFSVTTDADVMVSRTLELLEHPAWWAEVPSPSSHHQRGGEFNPDDEDEFLPPASQAVLRELKSRLEAVTCTTQALHSQIRRCRRIVGDKDDGQRPSPDVPPPSTVLSARTTEPQSATGDGAASSAPATISLTARATAINRRLVMVLHEFGDGEDEKDEAAAAMEADSTEQAPKTSSPTADIASVHHRRTQTAQGETAPPARGDGPGEEEGVDTEDDDDDDDDTAALCQICLERPVDIVMRPCGHSCCHLCFTRSCSVSDTLRLRSISSRACGPDAGEHTDATSLAAAQSGHQEQAEQSRPFLSSLSSVFTLSWDSFTAAPKPPEAPRCFFCKAVMERVVALAEGDSDGAPVQ